jgi:hypothetical protein
MPIGDLAPPPMYEDSNPLSGEQFPTSASELEISSFIEALPWIKYYSEVRSFIYIPKDFDFMDKELMTSIMNGTSINTLNVH